MEQNANYLDGFERTPIGPCSILRLIATSRSPDAPAEVTAIARLDVMLDDIGCHLGEVAVAAFGRRTGGCLTMVPACTPADLAAMVWEPYAPDVLVAHDLSMERVAFPPAITGTLPWIGTLRVARRAWDIGDDSNPAEIIERRGLPPDADPALTGDDEPGAAATKAVMDIATLVQAMVACPEVRSWTAGSASAAHGLGPILGEILADFALQGMVDMSTTGAAPCLEWPAPWDDDDAWRSVALDDLLQYAGSAEDGSGGMAVAEVTRRIAGSTALETKPCARVLLRRVRYEAEEGGRCDGW